MRLDEERLRRKTEGLPSPEEVLRAIDVLKRVSTENVEVQDAVKPREEAADFIRENLFNRPVTAIDYVALLDFIYGKAE